MGKEKSCGCAVCGALSRWKEISYLLLKDLEKSAVNVDAYAYLLGAESVIFVFVGTVEETVEILWCCWWGGG